MDRPITHATTHLDTFVFDGEDKLDGQIPWLTNHGGIGQAGRTLFAKTSGLLQCDKPSRGGQPSAIVAGISKATKPPSSSAACPGRSLKDNTRDKLRAKQVPGRGVIRFNQQGL